MQCVVVPVPNLTAAREVMTAEKVDPPGIVKMSRLVQSLVRRKGSRWHSQSCVKTFLKNQGPSIARAAYFFLRRINQVASMDLALPVTNTSYCMHEFDGSHLRVAWRIGTLVACLKEALLGCPRRLDIRND